jgi:penicillin-binding protein 2
MRDSKQGTPYQFRDHALFVAFAPYDKPEIAIAVVVEHGEHGGSAAGPIAGRMLRAYFDGKKPIPKPAVNSKGSDDNDSEDEEQSPSPKPVSRVDAAND